MFPENTEGLRVQNVLGTDSYGITVSTGKLLRGAMNQDLLPAVDDLGNFTGIVPRKGPVRRFSDRHAKGRNLKNGITGRKLSEADASLSFLSRRIKRPG